MNKKKRKKYRKKYPQELTSRCLCGSLLTPNNPIKVHSKSRKHIWYMRALNNNNKFYMDWPRITTE